MMKLYMCLKEADLFIHFFFIQLEADTKIKRILFFMKKIDMPLISLCSKFFYDK